MGLLSMILTAPAAPVRFVDWTARQVLDAAERELYDPSRIRQQLAELSERLDAGELSESEFDQAEDELLDQLEEAERYQQGLL
ncbi:MULTISPECIES: gas vesicle protein GvpG [Nocardiopsis]|uniref:Gas vesicle G n=1 Tax=Nocardiopsis dassonvillei (strain ATCC 23218 / DSM 43111 / CIP 107115 / JCM 7437 / KCTC 9190 / NBRC 14626 / NCTC 10488 / NRRL B-5397 / IMRU 509) TaxID=446468 RepID=D7AVT7_NOCDD|nr:MULTISPECIES: gas vesicle protein GvpG [Nocardiopsis]ADH67776.1 Gas vesicle G [Nocardiopsis dassonvillei subsp. dassonvillei DSM 43111]APC35943.1 gas vesicle protein [Nocardiopsis dassonvillei]NKY81305.1 gas vesicle protein [Nocardiopsis dassonvillei]VEI88253.1 Gas vesicle protein G [Nocardiopsis dassonvillei]